MVGYHQEQLERTVLILLSGRNVSMQTIEWLHAPVAMHVEAAITSSSPSVIIAHGDSTGIEAAAAAWKILLN